MCRAHPVVLTPLRAHQAGRPPRTRARLPPARARSSGCASADRGGQRSSAIRVCGFRAVGGGRSCLRAAADRRRRTPAHGAARQRSPLAAPASSFGHPAIRRQLPRRGMNRAHRDRRPPSGFPERPSSRSLRRYRLTSPSDPGFDSQCGGRRTPFHGATHLLREGVWRAGRAAGDSGEAVGTNRASNQSL